MRRRIPGDVIFLLVAAALIIVFGIASRSVYHIQLLSLAGIWSIAAMGLNLVTGRAGQLSIGQAGFMGIGAYTSTLLLKNLGFPFLGGLAIAGLIAIPFGLVVGYSALRLKGMHLAMATLAFSAIVYGLLNELSFITRGHLGITHIPGIAFFGWEAATPWDRYWFIWIVVFLVYLITTNLVRSRFGRALNAIREDEIAADAMGINVAWYKIQAFVVSAVLGAIAGAIDASYIGSVFPYRFGVPASITLLVMIVVGGLGSSPGPIVGATLLTILPEFGRAWEEYRLAGYGVLIILLMIFAPRGFVYLSTSTTRTCMSYLGSLWHRFQNLIHPFEAGK